MSETGDQFAGTASRSTKHSPRVDEELEHEIQGMLKGERATRAEEWREVEPQAEGDPDIDSSPAGTLVWGWAASADCSSSATRSAGTTCRSAVSRWA